MSPTSKKIHAPLKKCTHGFNFRMISVLTQERQRLTHSRKYRTKAPFRLEQLHPPKLCVFSPKHPLRSFASVATSRPNNWSCSAVPARYHHLVVWDTEAQRLAGAYRIGIVPEILKKHGAAGLYLDHVFHIDPNFYKRFPRSMELSRSFVLPDYQKDNRVLPLLWQGLAAISTRHKIDTLFGSVTISDEHHPASRALLVEYLKNNYADDPTTRFHPLVAEAYAGEGINALNPLIQEIEKGERSIPPLMRYYCQLGAKYIGYHVEAEFGNALYCLLRVHLPSIPEGYKKRFSLKIL